jgi:hypothetical protein
VRNKLAFLTVLTLAGFAAQAEDIDQPMDAHSALLVSPLAGWNRNETTIPASHGSPAMTLTDTEPEYGLYAMYASPRLVVNNIAFLTEASGSDVSGDIATANVYGDPDSPCTWHLGAGYVWHEIESDASTVTINEPIAKAGVVWRLPSAHLLINPYLGYAWLGMDTSHGDQNTESVLYGISAYWRWRMVAMNAKYYLEDNLDLDQQFDVVRAYGVFMFNRSVGMMARVEYMEEIGSKNTSGLLGPVMVF